MVALPIVLLIFITSNQPQGNLNEGLISSTTPQPEKGFVDNGKSYKSSHSRVNDLTATDFKFPDDNSKVRIVSDKKIIREKLLPDDKEEDKVAVPLYSLVKNDCGEGYALDENGVCQKTITVRGGKKFDSERRRKRHILDYDRFLPKKKSNENYMGINTEKEKFDCNRLYPGLVSDGVGGCKKVFKSLRKSLDIALPP